MHPLIWIAAGAASSLGWKWARSRQEAHDEPTEEAPAEIEPPSSGVLRTGFLYVAMGLVAAGRWARSAGSRLFGLSSTSAAVEEPSASAAGADAKRGGQDTKRGGQG